MTLELRRRGKMAEQVFTDLLGGGPVKAYVADGTIRRIRPLILDETDAKAWTSMHEATAFCRSAKQRFCTGVLAAQDPTIW